MKLSSSLFALIYLAVFSSAALVVHEKRATPPRGFVRTASAPSDQMLNLRINLVSRDLPGLEAKLMAAATPGSPTFRQWLSKEEVESFAAPTPETQAAVQEWLSNSGVPADSIRTLTPSGDWISFSVPVSQANLMLNANFDTFEDATTGTSLVRTLQFSVPSQLTSRIATIHPTTSFNRAVRGGPTITFPEVLPQTSSFATTPNAVPASCNSSITPACLQALYQIPTTKAPNPNSQIAVAGFSNQFANLADLKTFLTSFRPDLNSNTNISLLSVDGGTNSQTSQAGVEANLDIQYTVGVASNVPTTFVSVGLQTKDGDDGGFLDIINAMLQQATPPQAFTTSYGFNTEQDLSFSLTNAMCNSYMQLTARGVSIMFASGDGGVAATPGEQCSTMFNPTFPSCPFATLVGATENVPERGAELSAGGFSNYFAQPSYQADAVNAYLTQLGNTNAGKFNRTGRAFPDVSAEGQRVEIVVRGRTGLVAGTSCSSPIFASTIALLNNELLNAGKPVLGFLNPWLYANPQAFNDITTGNNPGCGTNGFPALKGWDPVTGMGTPNYPAMRIAAGLT